MATLSSALNYALAGLTVASAQSAVVSRNVSSAGDENYTRKTAEVVTLPGSGPAISQITRSSDRLLLDKLLTAGSVTSDRQVLLDALTRMSNLTGDPQNDQSIASHLGKLQNTLRAYEQSPASMALAQAVLTDARNATSAINEASAEASSIRTDADRGMAISADRISNLLAQFKVVNDSIVRGQGTAGDLTEALDQRDSILKLLSDEVGIRTALRSSNDLLIYAEGGAVLFEGSPRSISFRPGDPLPPGAEGNPLLIDGVPVTGPGAAMPISGGRMSAYASVRDSLAPQFSAQLDQIAAGLIIAFSEADPQIPGTLPSVEGLFRGTGAIPLVTNANPGLAGIVRVNELADPDEGGDPLMIRDGGFGGPAYVRNTEALAGYQVRISELTDALDTSLSFGSWGGLGGDASLKDFSAKSASWVEIRRQEAKSQLDASTASTTRAANTLSRVTGVNIDQEMATLLDLEKSYQASSKVLAVVNSMLDVLLQATGS